MNEFSNENDQNPSNSNLQATDELKATSRDLTAEKRDKGYFNQASTHISAEEANNNPDIVIRDGSRIHAGDNHHPSDVVRIGDTEMTRDIAEALGLMKDGKVTSPQEDFQRDFENTPETQEEDTRHPETILLHDQVELAFGENAPDTIKLVGDDIVENGEISEDGLNFLQNEMHMSEQSAKDMYSRLQEVGGQTLHHHLEIGDGQGSERLDFLIDLAEHGTQKQQAIVRNLWVQAATGALSKEDAAEAFDYLYEPYVG